MSSAYPISSPVEFTNTSAGDALIFNALGFSTPTQNLIVDFVVTNPGDLLFREGTGTSNTLERLAIGTAGQVLTVTGTAIAQVQNITTVADVANSLDGRYFLLNSPTEAHYFWINTSGGAATDPGLGFPTPADLLIDGHLKTGNMVSITTGDSAVAVATALNVVINALPDFITVLAAPLITVTNALAGACNAAANGLASTGFTIPAATTAGVSSLPAWVPPIPGMASESFLAEATAAVAASVAPGATWVSVVTPGIVTWSDTGNGRHDAGGIFTAGVFTVPTTGIYSISAEVAFVGNNSGNGGGGISGRRAVRQARIRKTNAVAYTVSFAETQTNSINLDPTKLVLAAANVSLTAADTIVIQVRHDANVSIGLSVNEDGTPTQGPAVYFTAHRVA